MELFNKYLVISVKTTLVWISLHIDWISVSIARENNIKKDEESKRR